MCDVDRRPLAKRRGPRRRPAGSAIDYGRPFSDLEVGAHAKGELSEITGLLAIDLVDRHEVVADLVVEGAIQTSPDEEKDASCKDANHQREDACVPKGQAGPDTQPADPHPRSRRSTNPTPRTV